MFVCDAGHCSAGEGFLFFYFYFYFSLTLFSFWSCIVRYEIGMSGMSGEGC